MINFVSFVVCSDSSGSLCNIFGTRNCSNDGQSCADCKNGYLGDQCNECQYQILNANPKNVTTDGLGNFCASRQSRK